MERIKINELNPLLDSHIRQSLFDDDVLTETYAMVAGVDEEDFHPAKDTPIEGKDPTSVDDEDL